MIHWKTHAIWAGALFLAVGLTYQLGRVGAFSTAEDLIVLPPKHIGIVDGGVVDSPVLGKTLYVDGTWQIDGEKDGFPKNYSQYRCDQKGDGYCRLTQTRFYRNSLKVDTTDFVQITKWDDQQVILEQTGSQNCRDFIVVVDLLTKEVKGITKDTPNRLASCSETLPPLAEPRISTMIDGFEISYPSPKKK